MKIRLTAIMMVVAAIAVFVSCGSGDKKETKAAVKLNCTKFVVVADKTVDETAGVKANDVLVLVAVTKDEAAKQTCALAADAVVTWKADAGLTITDPKADAKKVVTGVKATVKVVKVPAKEAKVTATMMKDGKPVTAVFKITKAAAPAPVKK